MWEASQDSPQTPVSGQLHHKLALAHLQTPKSSSTCFPSPASSLTPEAFSICPSHTPSFPSSSKSGLQIPYPGPQYLRPLVPPSFPDASSQPSSAWSPTLPSSLAPSLLALQKPVAPSSELKSTPLQDHPLGTVTFSRSYSTVFLSTLTSYITLILSSF